MALHDDIQLLNLLISYVQCNISYARGPICTENAYCSIFMFVSMVALLRPRSLIRRFVTRLYLQGNLPPFSLYTHLFLLTQPGHRARAFHSCLLIPHSCLISLGFQRLDRIWPSRDALNMSSFASISNQLLESVLDGQTGLK